MLSIRLVVISAVAACLEASSNLSFPPNFNFGAVTDLMTDSWNSSDTSEPKWQNSSIAYPTPEEVQNAADLGLNFYRFSISWSRLMPNGFANEVNEAAKKYYSDLVDDLRSKGVEPVVTLYQRGIPQRLQNLGGWANPLVTEWFASYARVAFTLYGERVKTWITINDPLIICDGGYSGLVAPGLHDPQIGSYLCSKNVLIAHAKAWRIYDEEFRAKFRGEISLSNQIIWYEPSRRSEKELADLAMENCAGRYSHPIYSKEGGWPPALEELIRKNSEDEGYAKSRLPKFSKEEIEFVRGTYDFYGVNHYTSRVVRTATKGEVIGPWPLEGSTELGVILETKSEWKSTNAWWFKQNPQGLRNVLVWLKEQYGDLRYLVTGNGYYNDQDQPEGQEEQFYRDHLTQLLLAIKKDDVNVTGYTAWTHRGSSEWSEEYKNKNKTKSMKEQLPHSALSTDHFYASVIRNHSLDVPEKSTPYVAWMSIASVLTVVIILVSLLKYLWTTRRKVAEYNEVALQDVPEHEQRTDGS